MTSKQPNPPAADNRNSRGTDGQAPRSDPNRSLAIGWAVLCVLTIPAMLWLVQAASPAPAPSPIVVAADHFGLDVETYANGQESFLTTCAACHGSWGEGLVGLGMPLRNSAFVQKSSDDELFALIANGRTAEDPATVSGVPMPPRGASPLVTDDVIVDVVAFLRTMQDPNAPVRDASAWVVSLEDRRARLVAVEAAAAKSGLDLTLPGRDLFVNSCSSCHGANGEGMEGLGKPFTNSEFIEARTDGELLNFLKTGRPIWDAENTTGVDMPPKGGNPALDDEDLEQIVEFVRAIHDSAGT